MISFASTGRMRYTLPRHSIATTLRPTSTARRHALIEGHGEGTEGWKEYLTIRIAMEIDNG